MTTTLMRTQFTVRLPLRTSASVARAIAKRARVDGRLVGHVSSALAGKAIPPSESTALFDAAIEAATEFARRRNQGEQWVSEHIEGVYRALADYRRAYKSHREYLESVGQDKAKRTIADFLDDNRRSADVYALINRKEDFTPAWDEIEQPLLDLVASGTSSITIHIRGIGDVTVRGAGRRDLGAEPTIMRAHLEVRADRRYLTIVVQHRIPGEQRRKNRDVAGVVRVAFTPSVIVADSLGVSCELEREAVAIASKAKAVRSSRKGTRRAQVLARRLMDARNNFERQYVVRLVERAVRDNLAIDIAYTEINANRHPIRLGVTRAMRRSMVDRIFFACRRRGVVMTFTRTRDDVAYTSCPHKRAVVVGVLVGETVVAMCPTCAHDPAAAARS